MNRSAFQTVCTLGLTAVLLFSTSTLADDHTFDWESYDDWEDEYGGDGGGSSSSISDAETSFKGAKMLQGDIDVSFGEVTAGLVEDDENYRYAFFSGNTLYAGVEDRFSNTVDMIVEFFWFESSINRGSDFWVAVVKARTSPNLEEGWYLKVADDPILSLHAETFNDDHNSGYRWDWSLPFESYGWDAYGSVTMESSYGIGTNAEGSIMTAAEYDEDGIEAKGTVQAKGYMNSQFKVQTKYQITLWRWEMMVQGTPADMDWDLYLDSPDRMDQNAYHEFFVVMQADEGKGFTMERLDLSGTLADPRWYWFDGRSDLSIAINDIELVRPDINLSDYENEVDRPDASDDDSDEEPNSGSDEPEDVTGEDTSEDAPTGDTTNITIQAADGGACSTTGNRTAPLGLGLALGLVLFGRRRD